MALYFRAVRWFSRLSNVLGQHSLNIINSNPAKYKECLEHMEGLTQQPLPDSALKKRLNMLFAVSNLNQSLASYRRCLYNLIKSNSIQSQSDLDRVVNWLTSQLRVNNTISEKDIAQRIKGSESGDFTGQLDRILKEQGVVQDISELSKTMREKYPSVDSKTIYKQINLRFKNSTKKEDKPIWEKISSLKSRLLPYETNSPQIYAQHKRITGGKLRFRFPPEPNGYLHIGHCKSIRTNFQSAKRLGGLCYLRFDDTNPDNESHEYIDNILKQVRWMGYEPDKVTYASDYFEQLMGFALQLIKGNKAYVCNTPRQQMRQERKNKQQNPDRKRDIDYSLKYFPNLQPHQTLRLRLDSQSSNPTLRDPVIYRNKSKPHPRTGHKYKVYPTYDFTHCINDSLEHIDYSLCSLEFQIRRQLYYTILHLLNLYKPIVWEYSRLNISGNVLSKRKITKLIQDKVVEGWGDPRLMTMAGLRNRGYSPSVITSFIDRINIARAGNENITQNNILILELKKQLFQTAERVMGVLEPVKLNLKNLKQSKQIKVNLFPEHPEKGSRSIQIEKQVFVQSTEKLRVGEIVNLKYFKKIKIDEVKSNGSIQATILEQQTDNPSNKKIKNIHWISPKDSEDHSLTEFFSLYKQTNAEEPELNTMNLKQYKAKIPKGLDKSKTYQFQRIGYFKFYKGSLICSCRM